MSTVKKPWLLARDPILEKDLKTRGVIHLHHGISGIGSSNNNHHHNNNNSNNNHNGSHNNNKSNRNKYERDGGDENVKDDNANANGKGKGVNGVRVANTNVRDNKNVNVNGNVSNKSEAAEAVVSVLGDYDVEEKLGKGSFAVVYRCTSRRAIRGVEEGASVAVKYLNQDKEKHASRLEFLALKTIKKAEETKRRRSKCLIKFYEVFEVNERYCYVFEYAAGGTLFERIVQQRTFDEREVRRAARDVFHGLEFLHNDALLMHRDIKPHNLIYKSRERGARLAIADFGLAKDIEDPDTVHQSRKSGTRKYHAPELYEGEGAMGFECARGDIYATGLALLEMFLGYNKLLDMMREEEKQERIKEAEWMAKNGALLEGLDDRAKRRTREPLEKEKWIARWLIREKRFEGLTNISEEALDCLKGLLKANPSERPSAREALKDKWLQRNRSMAGSNNQEEGENAVKSQRKEPEPDSKDNVLGQNHDSGLRTKVKELREEV